MTFFGHTLGWFLRYALIVMILGITYDQLERVLLKDVAP